MEYEQRGHRPVLLVSPGKFNRFTGRGADAIKKGVQSWTRLPASWHRMGRLRYLGRMVGEPPTLPHYIAENLARS